MKSGRFGALKLGRLGLSYSDAGTEDLDMLTTHETSSTKVATLKRASIRDLVNFIADEW